MTITSRENSAMDNEQQSCAPTEAAFGNISASVTGKASVVSNGFGLWVTETPRKAPCPVVL